LPHAQESGIVAYAFVTSAKEVISACVCLILAGLRETTQSIFSKFGGTVAVA